MNDIEDNLIAKEDVEARLAPLTARERKIVLLTISGLSHRKMAPLLGICRQRVDQIYNAALAKLRLSAHTT